MRASDSDSSPFVALISTASRATQGAASRATERRPCEGNANTTKAAPSTAACRSDVQRTAGGTAKSVR